MPVSRAYHPIARLQHNRRGAGTRVCLGGPARPARMTTKDEKDAKPELLKDAKADASTKPAAPTTGPATQPTTKPVIEVSPAIRAELDAVRDAYRGLKSLRLVGDRLRRVRHQRRAGEERRDRGIDLPGPGQVPPRPFGKGSKDPAARTRQAPADGLVVGCNGEKLYVFDRLRRQYQTAAAPQERVPLEKLGKPFGVLLGEQDPSLVLAISDDAGREILEGDKSAERGEDVKVGDVACFVINLVGERGDRQSFLIDPKTHLVRRVVLDIRNSVPKGAEVKKAELTIDYTEVSPDAEVKPEQLAWAAPKARGTSAPARWRYHRRRGDAGMAAAVAALVGKPAPDFKLKGMDGKNVSLAELKGTSSSSTSGPLGAAPVAPRCPELDKIYADHKADGLGHTPSTRRGEGIVQKFVDQTKLGIPVLLDGEGQTAGQVRRLRHPADGRHRQGRKREEGRQAKATTCGRRWRTTISRGKCCGSSEYEVKARNPKHETRNKLKAPKKK